MQVIKKLRLLVFTFILVGCHASPEYVRPDAALPNEYGMAHIINAQNHVVASEWWAVFEDQALNAVMQTALERNTDVQVAVARIEEAEAQMVIAGASRLPKVDANGSAERNRVSERAAFPAFGSNPRNSYELTLDGAIDLDFWGRLNQITKQARANYLASEYAKEAVMWTLSSLIVNEYITLRGLDAQLAVNVANQTVSQKSIELAQNRLTGGVASKLDVLQAQSQLDDLKLQLNELERLRALSLNQLQLLSGDFDLMIESNDAFSHMQLPLPAVGMPSELLENRPDIQQAERRLAASHANMELAKKAFYPSVSLTGQYGGQSLQLSDLLRSTSRIWSLGLAFNLPIFNNGRLDAELKIANATQKERLADYIATVRAAFTEVNDSLVNVSAFRETEQLTLDKEIRAKEMLTIAQNRYREGYSAYLDVLEAQRNHHAAKLSHVESRQNLMIASTKLIKAIGGQWQQASEDESQKATRK